MFGIVIANFMLGGCMDVYLEIDKIFEQLVKYLLVWEDDIAILFEQVSKKLTASISWEFLNKQLSRKIEK